MLLRTCPLLVWIVLEYCWTCTGLFPFMLLIFKPPLPLWCSFHIEKPPRTTEIAVRGGSELKKTINVCPRGARAVHRLLPSIARYPLQQFD